MPSVFISGFPTANTSYGESGWETGYRRAVYSSTPQIGHDMPAQLGYEPALPFVCRLCGKGYQTDSGLRHHVKKHSGRRYKCPVCGVELTYNHSVTRHLKTLHAAAQCLKCSKVLPLGEQYNKHVLQC